MRLWRISAHASLSGEGGLLVSGRWHSRGRRIVYLADHPASALLEVLVHLEVDSEDLPRTFQLLAIDVPDRLAFQSIAADELAPEWRSRAELTRALGDRWLTGGQTAFLRVPSAIVPFASNWLANPAHPDFGQARMEETFAMPFDTRLLGRP